MKRLFLLRHAKSSWDDSTLSDFDRPLNERGLNAAPFMGELMAKRLLFPDAFISSPAKRALQTVQLFKESAGSNTPIKFDERIYEASPQTLRQVVSEMETRHRSAMIVGHNPGIEGFISLLTGERQPMPTAAIAIIDLKIERWNEIESMTGSLVETIRPKEEMRIKGIGL
ncbi:MAG: SixA phosphatase family protein [Blastocatellia bacterium]